MHKINAGDLEIIVIYHQIRLKEFTDQGGKQTANAQIFITVQLLSTLKKMLYVCIDLKFLQRSYFWKDQHSAAFYFIIYVNVLVLAHLPATLNILDFLQNVYLLRSTQSTVQMYNPFRKEFLMCLLNKL